MEFSVNIVVILSTIALNVIFKLGAKNVIRGILIGLELVLRIGYDYKF